MITSPHNEKLKLVRKLAERRHRDREGCFVTEGEDLLETGLLAGAEPRFVLCVPGFDAAGAEEVEPELLRGVSTLGSGSRVIAVWEQRWVEPAGPVCLYLDAVGDPGNVGAIIRTADALIEGCVAIGPGTADPYGPKAVRAAMGSLFARPPARAAAPPSDGERDTLAGLPRPMVGLVAHGGSAAELPPAPLTLCLGSERDGLSAEALAACEATYTLPTRPGGAESLNVAAAAAICCERVSSPFVPAVADPASAPEGDNQPPTPSPEGGQ